MRNCPKCNSEVREGAKICRVCGGIVDEAPATVDVMEDEVVIELLDDEEQPAPIIDVAAPDGALTEHTLAPWVCKNCGEKLHGDFGICWKCGTYADGTQDPEFKSADDFESDDFAVSVVGAGAMMPAELTAPAPHRVEQEPDDQGGAIGRGWTCPDCGAPLRRIKLIDRTGESHVHDLLSYAAADAELGWFICRFEEAGRVGARMCTSCGRILLYAEPNA